MSDKIYGCVEFSGNVCTKWATIEQQTSFFTQFTGLMLSDVTQIVMATALLFAVAWVFKEISNFTKAR